RGPAHPLRGRADRRRGHGTWRRIPPARSQGRWDHEALSYARGMAQSEKLRLGGMALANGVLVHGPTSCAAAVRTRSGEPRVAGARKRFVAAELDRPILRGPARLVEAFAVLPQMRRALPQARLPFERPAVIGSMLASATLVRAVRDSRRLG